MLTLVGALVPAPAAASLPSWRDSRLLDAELRRETPLPAGSEIKAAAPHVHGAFCPHALPQPKTRVRGFELGLHCSIGGEAGLTCRSRPAYPLRYGEHAVERSAFTGYEWDPELGLFNAKARYFDPQIGRFTSQDSFLGEIDNAPSLHRYLYANPTTFVDPTGHFSIKDFAKGAVNVVMEPFRQVADVAVAGAAAAEGIDAEHVQMTSALGGAQRQRVLEGQGAGTAALKGVGETVFAVGTVGIGPTAVAHVQLARAFVRGEIAIDQYDAALSEIAGGQAAGAAIAKVAGGRSGARAGTEIQVQPKGAGAVRVIEGNRGATTVPEGPIIIEMVPNAEGTFVAAFEAQGVSGRGLPARSPGLMPAAEQPNFLGPGAQPRGLLETPSVGDTISSNYQRYYNDAARQVVTRFNRGEVSIPSGVRWRTTLGQQVDNIARLRLRNFLEREGIAEGPQERVRVNRWLRDPAGSGKHRIPDVMLDNSRRILDGTIGRKLLTDPQPTDFAAFSGGYDVRLIRPETGPLSKK